MTLPFAYFDGKVSPTSQCNLNITDLSIQRGYGIFDYFCYHDGNNSHLDQYFNRLYNSASSAHLTLRLTKPALKKIIDQLYEQNEVVKANMKVILTAGYSPNGYTPTENANLIILSYQHKDNPTEHYTAGVKLITHEHQRPWPEIKSTNYFCSVLLAPRMKAEEAVDVLYISNGLVRETSRANIFLVKDGNILTPKTQILKGITRSKILSNSLQLPVEEREITKQEILDADEVFITSTTKLVMPVTAIDNVTIHQGKVGPITKRLLNSLF